MRVGFVGLGQMGLAIARNFAAAGHEVVAWNRSPRHAPPGVRVVDGLAQTLDGDILVSMLADDRAIREVLIDTDALARVRTHVNMATIGVALGRELQAMHERLGSRYVSAPVFGRPEAAAAKTLFVVAAGDQAAIRAAQPLFDATAQRTFNVGAEAGQANLIKLCGNLLVAIAVEGLGEAAALARASGTDVRVMMEVLTKSIFDIPVYQGYGALIAGRRYEPARFKVPLALKDIELALAAGEAAQVSLPSARLLQAHLRSAIERGWGEKDWAVFCELLGVKS
jgi:3-hydroxyisobutyrate dehydrogenase-like beta-hydroxyacid dehydrogenase